MSRRARGSEAVLARAEVLLVGIVLTACHDPRTPQVEPQPGLVEQVHVPGRSKVDLLFVVDTSPSMASERELLVDQLEIMARELIIPIDPEAPFVLDLRVGVVSAEMDDPGTGGMLLATSGLPGCQGVYSAADCDRASCPWLSHSLLRPNDGTDPADPPLWEDLACIAGALGPSGSMVEQPLAASLAALTTQAGPGRPNQGFLRNDSLLAGVRGRDLSARMVLQAPSTRLRVWQGVLHQRGDPQPLELCPPGGPAQLLPGGAAVRRGRRGGRRRPARP